MIEDPFAYRMARLDELGRTLRMKSDEQMLDTIFPGWREASKRSAWLKRYWPQLYADPSPTSKLLNGITAWFKRLKGYRIVHEDDLD